MNKVDEEIMSGIARLAASSDSPLAAASGSGALQAR